MDVLLVVCMLAWDGFISADQGKCEAVVTRYRTWALKMQKKNARSNLVKPSCTFDCSQKAEFC
jgi:hypothetical protein